MRFAAVGHRMGVLLDKTLLRRCETRVGAALACALVYLPLLASPGAALFGALFMPLYLVWYWVGMDADPPFSFVVLYWVVVLACHSAFVVTRYWILFVIPCVIFAVNFYGYLRVEENRPPGTGHVAIPAPSLHTGGSVSDPPSADANDLRTSWRVRPVRLSTSNERARNDDRESFQELRRFEADRPCAVAPRPASSLYVLNELSSSPGALPKNSIGRIEVPLPQGEVKVRG